MNCNQIYLTQTDSIAGFLCSNPSKINEIKNRDLSTKNILAISSFARIKQIKNFPRIPQKHKNLLRRSKKTSFIVGDFSFRVIDKQSNHFRFINKFDYMYSSSANLHNESFDFDIAFGLCDVCVFGKNKINSQDRASKIIKLHKNKQEIVRV